MATPQLAARCLKAVEACRAELADLQAACKGASSHTDKCAELLAAATDAVAAVAALVAAAGSDPARCRSAQQLAVRVQSSLDQGEALVKTHCHHRLLSKLASHAWSQLTHEVPLKFDAAASELENLAKKARHEAQPRVGSAARMSVSSQAQSSVGPERYMSATTQLSGLSVGSPCRTASITVASRGSSVTAPASRASGGSGVVALGSSSGSMAEASGGMVEGSGVPEADTPSPLQLAAALLAPGAVAGVTADPPSAGGRQDQAQQGQQQEQAQGGDELEGSDSFPHTMLLDWADVQRVQKLADGAQGEVWFAFWQETKVVVQMLGSLAALGLDDGALQRDASGAIQLDAAVQRALDQEVGLMQEMRHPNIILFMGVVLEPAAVVTEYCARGSLRDILAAASSGGGAAAHLTWPRRLAMARDIAKGMLYLHGRRPAVVHRRLTSSNLLIDGTWRVKVCGFSLSRSGPALSGASTASSQAPQVLTSQQYGKEGDVRAFGLILWELLTWQAPAPQESTPAVPNEAEAAQLPGGALPALPQYLALIRQCWAPDPAARPSFEQVAAALRRIAETLPEPEAEEE